MALYSELKRRNVLRVSLAYLVVAWLILQVGDTLAPALRLPDWAMSLLAFFLILGFPVAVLFAWAFEITPEGVKREKEVDRATSITQLTGRKLDYIIIGLLMVAVGYFALDKYVINPEQPIAAVTVSGETSIDQQSIAVLPFVNMSSDPEQEYFSDGLSEELLNLLAKIPELRVTSRSSAFYFKGKDFKIADVGRELNVAHVLEGSVRKSGNEIRITAQLIDVKTDAHLWSETWDRTLDDIFVVQDEISLAVVDALKIRILGELPRAYATTPEAYAWYLQAMQLGGLQSEESLRKSVALLTSVLEIDPAYAPAWGQLGSVYTTQGGFGLRPVDEAFKKARDAAHNALELDPNLAAAHALLADIAMNYDLDLYAAKDHVSRAVSLDGGQSSILTLAGIFARYTGEIGEARSLAHEAIALDPLNSRAYFNLGITLIGARIYDEAMRAFRQALAISPGLIGAHTGLGMALLHDGDPDAALAEFEAESVEAFRLLGRAIVYHLQGRAEDSDAALSQLIDSWGGLADFQIAVTYMHRDEHDKALDWLERGYESHDSGMSNMNSEPIFEALRNEPRYEALVTRMGLQQE